MTYPHKIALGEFLQQSLTENSWDLSPAIQEQLINYLNLLHRWNQVFNLTAIRDVHDMVVLHLLDSLSILPYLQGNRIIDVGTGAGLPGIPLALIFPEKKFFLLDSNGKKTRFLTQAVSDLGIKNIEIVHSRCETFRPDECFDSIVTRAFATIKTMLTVAGHLLSAEGHFLAMKGVYPAEEIAEIPKNFTVIAVHRLIIERLNAERHLVCIQRGLG